MSKSRKFFITVSALVLSFAGSAAMSSLATAQATSAGYVADCPQNSKSDAFQDCHNETKEKKYYQPPTFNPIDEPEDNNHGGGGDGGGNGGGDRG